MAQRNIDFGAFPDDPDADPIRSAFEKVQLNFTEVFAGLGDQAVVSVNRTAGPGIYLVNGSPVGNVVLGANISCVQVSSSTLQVTRDAAGNGVAGGSATITDSTQTLYVDLPTDLANIGNVTISGDLAANNITATNNLTTANLNVTSSATMLVPLTVTSLTATGNITGGNLSVGSGQISGGTAILANVYANSGTIKGANLSGTLTTAAQPNITSVGTLTSLAVTATTTTGNLYANAGVVQGQYLKGDGSNISSLTGANVTGEVGFAAVANSVAGGNVTGEVAFAATANAVAGSNVSGQVGNALVAGTVYTASQPNITSLGTLSILNVSGNANVNNIGATGGIFTYVTGDGANLTNVPGGDVTGEVSFAATANSVAGANVSGEVSYAATANAVAGGNVSGEVAFADTANNIAGSNVSGEVAFAAVANSVAGANVSDEVAFAATANSVAGANVSGQVSFAGTANAVSGANVSGNVANAVYAFSVDGANVSGEVAFADTANSVAGANVSGEVAFAAVANSVAGANVSGEVSNAASANAVAGANVSGTVANATYADSAGTAGTVTTASQPNITSVGTLSSLSVTGNISAGNVSGGNLVSANFIQGDGSLLTNISVAAGSYIENGTSNVTVDGTNATVRFNIGGTANVLRVTQTSANLTGTLNVSNIAELNVLGTSNLGPVSNVTITGGSANQYLMTTGSGNLVWTTTTLSPAAGANSQVIFNDGGSTYAGNANLTFNKSTGRLTASQLAGTLTTAAQPNITSVGALTSLILYGNLNSNASIVTNAGNIEIAGGSGIFKGNGSGLSDLAGSNVSGEVAFAATANSVAGANVSGEVSNAATANAVALANVSGAGNIASINIDGNASTILYGNGVFAAAPITYNDSNVTSLLAAFGSNSITTTGNVSVGNIIGNGQALTGLAGANVTGEVSFAATANSVAGANVSGTVANATFATSAGTATSATSATSATTAGTVTTSAQPNITSVGTLTSLTVTGNVSAGNVSGAGGVFTYVSGDGANLTSIAGANVTGTVANATFATSAGSATSATTAGTVTTAAQPNITSVGTLSSLAVTGNVSGGNVSVSGFHIRSVATSIIAAGTTQGTATALTKEINVVATVSASQGVRLPTAVAGMVITITNTSGTEVLVYPATGGRINTLSTNIAYGVAPGATIQFIAPSTTQWYTVGASYA